MSDLRARCIVIDDNPDILDLVERLVGSISLEFEGYLKPREFLRDFDCRGPGVIVSDLIMPGMTGIDLLRSVKAQHIPLPFIIVTGFADVDASVSAFRAGAFDFIEKPFSKSSFLAAIEHAVSVSNLALAAHDHRHEIDHLVAGLSDREVEVIKNMVAGASNKEIARILGISHRTVEHYRQCGLKKLGVHSAMDLGTPEWRDALHKAAPTSSDFVTLEYAIASDDKTGSFSHEMRILRAFSGQDWANSNQKLPKFS